MRTLKVAVLLSGSGTTLENLFDCIAAGKLDVEIVAVIGSRAGAFGLERARRHNVPAILIEKRKFQDAEAFSTAIYAALEPYKPALIALAGFMSLLKIPPAYRNRVMNVHPAMLPDFGGKGYYGHHVHEAVVKAGVKKTGCTVHFVDDQYDHGPIIIQKEVSVLPTDTAETLGERVQAAEREVYPQAIQLFAEGRLRVDETRKVVILPKTG